MQSPPLVAKDESSVAELSIDVTPAAVGARVPIAGRRRSSSSGVPACRSPENCLGIIAVSSLRLLSPMRNVTTPNLGCSRSFWSARFGAAGGREHFSEGSTLRDSCADERMASAVHTATKMAKAARNDEGRGEANAVWDELLLAPVKSRQPSIPEFELVVERPEKVMTSFCWSGPAEKVGRTLRATAKDFVPPDKLITASSAPGVR